MLETSSFGSSQLPILEPTLCQAKMRLVVAFHFRDHTMLYLPSSCHESETSISPHPVCLFDGYTHKSEIPQTQTVFSRSVPWTVNRTMHTQSESHNATSLRASAHAPHASLIVVSYTHRVS